MHWIGREPDFRLRIQKKNSNLRISLVFRKEITAILGTVTHRKRFSFLVSASLTPWPKSKSELKSRENILFSREAAKYLIFSASITVDCLAPQQHS